MFIYLTTTDDEAIGINTDHIINFYSYAMYYNDNDHWGTEIKLSREDESIKVIETYDDVVQIIALAQRKIQNMYVQMWSPE